MSEFKSKETEPPLLPCPSCGGQAEHLHIFAGEELILCVNRCESCGVYGRTQDEATAAWNDLPRTNPKPKTEPWLKVGSEKEIAGLRDGVIKHSNLQGWTQGGLELLCANLDERQKEIGTGDKTCAVAASLLRRISETYFDNSPVLLKDKDLGAVKSQERPNEAEREELAQLINKFIGTIDEMSYHLVERLTPTNHQKRNNFSEKH